MLDVDGLYLIEFLHQTTTPGAFVAYNKQITAISRIGKPAQRLRRSRSDAIFSISKNKFSDKSEKFQLLGYVGFALFCLAPEIKNLAVLLVCNCKYACEPGRRH